MTPSERTAAHLNTAAVCRGEAEARRQTQPAYAAILDTWAANQERRAIEAEAGDQPDLFTQQRAA